MSYVTTERHQTDLLEGELGADPAVQAGCGDSDPVELGAACSWGLKRSPGGLPSAVKVESQLISHLTISSGAIYTLKL